jgi:hypothetical protein
MPIEFRCGSCHKLLRVGDHAAGRLVQCPECGAQMTLSLPAGEEGHLYQSPPIGPPPRPANTGGKATASLLLGILSLLLAPCLCCGCAIFLIVPMAVTGLLMGIQGLQSENRSAAVTGIALCSLALAVSLFALALHGVVNAPHLRGAGMHWGR